MNRKGKPRKFPYYIITDVDKSSRRMQILDLNTIQKEEYFTEDGKEKKRILYEEDQNKHEQKWIDVPGRTQKEQDQTINWILDMAFIDGAPHTNKYMVYDHRRQNSDPIHEENIVSAFRQWREAKMADVNDATE